MLIDWITCKIWIYEPLLPVCSRTCRYCLRITFSGMNDIPIYSNTKADTEFSLVESISHTETFRFLDTVRKRKKKIGWWRVPVLHCLLPVHQGNTSPFLSPVLQLIPCLLCSWLHSQPASSGGKRAFLFRIHRKQKFYMQEGPHILISWDRTLLFKPNLMPVLFLKVYVTWPLLLQSLVSWTSNFVCSSPMQMS